MNKKPKIREAIRVMNEDTLRRVFEKMKTHLTFVIREEDRHFEHNMNLMKTSVNSIL